MKDTRLVIGAALACALLSGPVVAQGVPQTVDIAKVNVQKLPAGYRASKIIGSSVVNDGNELIGKIDDLTRQFRREAAVCCAVNWRLSRNRQSLCRRALSELEPYRRQDRTSRRLKRYAQNASRI